MCMFTRQEFFKAKARKWLAESSDDMLMAESWMSVDKYEPVPVDAAAAGDFFFLFPFGRQGSTLGVDVQV